MSKRGRSRLDRRTESALEEAGIPATGANSRLYSVGQAIVGINFFAAMFWGGIEGHTGISYWLTAPGVPPLLRFGSLSLLYLLPCVVLLLTRRRVPALYLGVLHPTLILAAFLTILLPFTAVKAFALPHGPDERSHVAGLYLIAQLLDGLNLGVNLYLFGRQKLPRNGRAFVIRLLVIQGVIFSTLAVYEIKFL